MIFARFPPSSFAAGSHDVHRGGRVELRADGLSSAWRSPNGDVEVVADADVDNLEELESLGLSVRDRSNPAEVIGRAYQRWGDDSAQKLLGDFAFVVWDARQRTLYAARDQLGIRPLYWRENGGEVVLGSVARDVAGPHRQPSSLGVALFILGEYGERGHTLFQEVSALPPAHHGLRGPRSTLQLRRYWSPVIDPELAHASDEAIHKLFAIAFREAVRCRLQHGPIGVEVSGGLDSAAVAGQAAALSSDELPTALNLAFPGMDCDETSYCDAVLSRWQLEAVRHDALRTELTHAPDDHPDLIFDPTLSCYGPLLSMAQGRGVRVVLTGVGGDQTMDESGLECADAVRSGRLKDVLDITGIGRHPFSPRSYQRFLQDGLRPLIPEPLRRAARRIRRSPALEPLTTDAQTTALRHIYGRLRAEASKPTTGMLRELECQSLLMPVIQSHRLGARYGIRFRHPFLDRRVVELMLSAPPRVRLRHGTLKGKPVLRRALGHFLPRAVAQRTDAGEFSAYLRYVLLEKNRQNTRALFDESRLADLGIIDGRAMRSVLDGTTQTHINRLTLATGMELWLRRTWT